MMKYAICVRGTARTRHSRVTLQASRRRLTATHTHAFLLTPIPKLFHTIYNCKLSKQTLHVCSIFKKLSFIKIIVVQCQLMFPF